MILIIGHALRAHEVLRRPDAESSLAMPEVYGRHPCAVISSLELCATCTWCVFALDERYPSRALPRTGWPVAPEYGPPGA